MVRRLVVESESDADNWAPFAVLSHIISQLRPGADLSRITLPTFILEPRSMLERITKCVRLSHVPAAECAKMRNGELTAAG